MSSPLEGHRGTSQFIDTRRTTPEGETIDVVTRRPSSHTKRAGDLGIEQVVGRQRRIREEGENKGKTSVRRASGETVYVKPQAPRPEFEARRAVEEGMDANIDFEGDLVSESEFPQSEVVYSFGDDAST